MLGPVIVIDSNVLVAALRSRTGASFRLLSLVGTGRFEIAVSVPLVLEYESALTRHAPAVGLSPDDVRDVIDYLCSVARRVRTFFLWRPLLRDADDDHVLELAVAGNCDTIVTFNVRNFRGAATFAIDVSTPAAFLRKLGALP